MPEIEILGVGHNCRTWLPTPNQDKDNLVIKCVCSLVYICRYYDYDGSARWAEYGWNLVDTLNGHDVLWIKDGPAQDGE